MKQAFKRFLIPSYLKFSIRIKLKGLAYRITNGARPYQYFKQDREEYSINFSPSIFIRQYHSFDYLDFYEAEEYYKNKASVIHSIMLALFEYNQMLKDQTVDNNRLITLAEHIEKLGVKDKKCLRFYVQEKFSKFDIDGRITSGIIQGKAASFFLRCYKETNQQKYLDLAKSCLLVCQEKIENDGVLRSVGENQLWAEEYVSPSPSMVLNGFLFVLIGYSEYLSLADDEELSSYYRNFLATLLTWLPKYFVGKDVLYSMYDWDFCNVHYLGVLTFQLEHLHLITGIETFKIYHLKCKEQADLKLFSRLFVIGQ